MTRYTFSIVVRVQTLYVMVDGAAGGKTGGATWKVVGRENSISMGYTRGEDLCIIYYEIRTEYTNIKHRK